ncbi:uncharacterized protein LOC127428034 [Myxocyprinus asiaticus]|uniref:uncharacterized protein LOC127428034 n=1 Tax=Myxocyprinus asiaticus TaxID=70543 RepID=UPI0022218045|nr:uncharacterized protein LOC127428034 [Myxocyprinus asiaticus]
MYNQGPTIRRIDPTNSFNDPSADWNASGNSEMGQFQPPPYKEYTQYPNAAYPPPGNYPNPSGYTGQQYGAPGGPQGPYPGLSAYYQGAYPGQPVVTIQPAFITRMPPAKPSPDHMCYSVFTMLCCCFPLGIAALVYSVSTRDANSCEQQELAARNSKMAFTLNGVALGIGMTVYVSMSRKWVVHHNRLKPYKGSLLGIPTSFFQSHVPLGVDNSDAPRSFPLNALSGALPFCPSTSPYVPKITVQQTAPAARTDCSDQTVTVPMPTVHSSSSQSPERALSTSVAPPQLTCSDRTVRKPERFKDIVC